ncbi:alpha beta fold family hydrolase [Companilactobacillus tucceti DSM 20183]|uniref:Alpha beta fold family hydrolase n=1 Tax=Companilactobacillus tucceti DSM 20183 TaxID=1423811 RepID=A0A0R1IYF1_9LACO|nr:alpha/beta fold hydrolase [Companilactobacillus tucceti]KRK63932.1 alpha beta fold family hydrolase [Companilactobacillus tucceti DSM 20183]
MIVIILILLLLVIVGTILNIFFLYIQKRGSSTLGSNPPNVKRDPGLDQKTAEFLKIKKTELKIESKFNHNQLYGWFTEAKYPTESTVILVHGFAVDHNSLNIHAQLFYNLGYNVLQIDNQAAGKSSGKYMGYGFIESLDLIDWVDKIKSKYPNGKIVLFGASMGAATVMLASPKLNGKVSAIIEDSGYTSTKDILSYHAQNMYHIKGRLLINGISLFSRIRAGFFYGQADCLKALSKNKIPVLFMHGQNDFTVPFEMEEKLYTCGNFFREKYVSQGVHIRSYYIDSINYQKSVEKFLKHIQ